MQNNRFSRIKTRRRNVNFSSYNSGIIEKLKNKRLQRQAAMVTALFLFFQILSPFGVYIKSTFAAIDTTPPVITGTNFTNTVNTCDTSVEMGVVAVGGDFVVTFSDLMNADTIGSGNIKLKRESDDVAVSAVNTLDSLGHAVTINPDSDLNINTKYYLFVNTSVQNSDGVAYTDTACSVSRFNFQTAGTDSSDRVSPTSTLIAPSSSTNVPVTSGIRVRFSEQLQSFDEKTTKLTREGSADLTGSTGGGLVVDYDFVNHILTINPSQPLAYSTNYTIVLPTGLKDIISNVYTDPVYTITTLPVISNIGSSKANGSYSIGASIDISVTFAEAVTIASNSSVTVTLETGSVDRMCTFSSIVNNIGTCSYTVQAGDTSSDLNVKSVSGNIKDSANRDISDFTPAINLAANKAIVIDTTAPVLTAGAVNRTSDTAGTVKFTSNEAGNYFYYIAADGASVPTIDTSGTGTSCTTSETTIVLAGLTLGAKDVYVIVKDSAGNISADTFKIDVAAFGTVSTPTFTPPAGAVSAGQGVVINSEAGATIKYTTDGSTPTCTTGTTYSSSITINTATTIKAIACKSGSTDSAVATAAYTISSGGGGSQDTTAPSITPGTVTRTSASAGTVVFTSNESGKYYFLVAGDGDSAPTVNQIIGGMTGVSYNAGNVTVNISGLASGAKDIYFILEDSVPNRTVATKFDMPAYVNPDTCPSCEIKGTDDTVNKNGATINFPDNPSNLGDGFNIAVTQNAASSRTAPTNKTIQNIYDITPSKSLTGTYSATITLAYPSGQTYKSGDTVMYWDINSNAWSSSGISGITGSGGNISFSTNHFTEFAIITDALASNNGGTNNGTGSTTGTGGTTVGGILPTAGSTILNMFLNFMLAIGGYVLIQRYLKKSRYGAFVN